jgi:FKBP-type peptidyl-prolyl cis-trans isomerase (trigger factor)
MVEEALAKHGLKSASQRAKMKEQLHEEMEEALAEQVRLLLITSQLACEGVSLPLRPLPH